MEELKTTAEKLEQELTMRGKYYFKGFTSLLQGMMASLENFVNHGATPEREAHIRSMLSRIVNLYQQIPFQQITNHPDYDLLLKIKEAISQLTTEVENVLIDGKDIENSCKIIEDISEKGNEYRNRLTAVLKQLNSQPGHEQDRFKTTDINGRFWESAL